MKLSPRITWQIDDPGGESLDPRIVPLLRGTREHGTLGGAARSAGVSYRSAWNLLNEAARLLGAPLVLLERGRGARLDAAGIELLDGHARLEREVAGRHIELAIPARTPKGNRGLRINASHDLALAELCEDLARTPGAVASLSIRGSLECLAAFARGEADVAGFHLPPAGMSGGIPPGLDARRDRLVRFAEREQGLIVRRGNPRRLHGLGDVAARGARFINRQKGSGTRILLEALLAAEGVPQGTIRGYATEEHTHLAVAATIASGGADAGFGLRAAAARFQLDFIALAKERYWLAIRADSSRSAAMATRLAAIRGPRLRAIARRLPGYSVRGAGDVLGVSEALGEPRR